MSYEEAVAQSRYRHPSRAGLKAEIARDTRRERHRKAGLTLGAVSAAAAGIVSALRMMRKER